MPYQGEVPARNARDHEEVDLQLPLALSVSIEFLIFHGRNGKAIKRYQYTAIDDVTRVRALKIYDRHTQANAIAFIDYVIARFPFRIREVRTDNGHEFQAKFHWHVEDQGIRHAYIKPTSPQLNGKVECLHRIDEQEFYQLLTYTGDVDLHRSWLAGSLEASRRVQRNGTLRSTPRTPINIHRCLVSLSPLHRTRCRDYHNFHLRELEGEA